MPSPDTSGLQQPRRVERLVSGQPTQDGAGVKLTRVLAANLQQRLDPFLMLDHFASDRPDDYIAGFPEHPHRGFETVTYMVAGRMRHRDSAGHEGLISTGGVQWMTAGRGLIHSEMPEQEHGLLEGFQLWLNLAAKSKMRAPWYRDIPSEEVPEVLAASGVTARVICGHCHGVAGAVQREDTEPLFLDLLFGPQGGVFEQALPAAHHAFAYVYRGQVQLADATGRPLTVPAPRMALLDNTGDGVRLQSDVSARVLLLAGRPLNEPIAQYGPFVMNTRAELIQAAQDYQQGKLVA